MVVKMMIPKFMTKPSGLVRRIRKVMDSYKVLDLTSLNEQSLTEPRNRHGYTFDKYVDQTRGSYYHPRPNNRDFVGFRFFVVPLKLSMTLAELEGTSPNKVKELCELVCDEFVKSVNVSPSKRWRTEDFGDKIRLPLIEYNYKNCGFDLFIAPSHETAENYVRLYDPNPSPFGMVKPGVFIDFNQKHP